jgi:hypothetical protein
LYVGVLIVVIVLRSHHQEPEECREILAAELKLLFGEVLNPVSPQAIQRVRVPEGLDLDAWIGPQMEDIADEYVRPVD